MSTLPTPGFAVVELTTTPTLAALADALEALRDQPGVNCVVLAGERFAGGDEDGVLRWLEHFELPSLFAFEGEPDSGAVAVALACDIRICDAEARLHVAAAGRRRLLTLIGVGASVELIRRRGVVDAETALAWGLVSEVTPAGEARKRAAELAATIASRGPVATRLAREAIWRGLDIPLEQALRFETDLTLLLQTTKDRAEGVRAFIEKRPPRFIGE